MAITYVGGKGAGSAGRGGGEVDLTTGLSGGSGTGVSVGDLIVVTVSVGSAGRQPDISIATPSGYTPLTAQRTTATTYDTNVQTCYKIADSGDTSVTIPESGSTQDGIAYAIQVFSGVDSGTPMDVTPTYNTGSGTNNLPNPQPITPATAGAWIVCCGGGAASAGGTYAASYLTNFLTYNGNDTNDGNVGCGYYTGWSSGEYDPAAYTGGSTNAANSWGATTLALRPAAEQPRTVSKSDAADVTESRGAALHPLIAQLVSDSVSADEVHAQKVEPLVHSSSDAVSASEACVVDVPVVPLASSVSDAASAAESTAAIYGYRFASASDSASVSESSSASLDRLVPAAVDSASMAESVAIQLDALKVARTDVAAASDQIAARLDVLLAARSDSAGASDATADRMAWLVSSSSDPVSVAEDAHLLLEGEVEAIDVALSDAVGTLESVGRILDPIVSSRQDTTSVSDATVAALGTLVAHVSDVVAATESFSALAGKSASVVDLALISDVVSASLDVLQVLLSDAVGVSDAAYALIDSLPVQVLDAASSTDSVSVTAYDTQMEIVLSDATGIAEGYPVRTIPDPRKALGHRSKDLTIQ